MRTGTKKLVWGGYGQLITLTPFYFQILSRDSVTVTVDAVVYYRVHNPTIAVSNVENFRYRPVVYYTYIINIYLW